MASPSPSTPAPGSGLPSGPRLSSFWFWIPAAALLLFGLYLTRRASQLRGELTQLESQFSSAREDRNAIERNLDEARKTSQIIDDPASRRFALGPLPASQRPAAPALRVWWHPRLGLVIAGVHIPPPAGDRSLHAWLLLSDHPEKALSAGTLLPRPDPSLFLLYLENPPAPLGAVQSIVITEEAASAPPAPTGAPLWSGSPR